MVSRRDFLAGSAVALVGGAVGAPRLARAWQQQPAPVTPVFTDIRRNVGFFTGRGGTIGYLIDAKGVAVVDSQFRDAAKLCLDGLNERSKNRPVDRLVNTHHHGDHTDGNVVFKGVAKKVVAHARAAELMRNPPPSGNPPTTEQLYPDTTFTDVWREQVGDDWMRAKFYGPAHTSGDAVITFERANVAHMGDLGFNQRHAIVDRAAGASMRGWIGVLEKATKDHSNDTIYIFGHAGANLPVTGGRAVLMQLRDYLTAVLAFVDGQIKAGKTREEVLAMRDPLKGFETFGRFPNANPRDPLTVAYEELTVKG
jgi:glyoxylase-like metal-dependent hydrolase (beta-lactamase superfamily II)